MKVTLVRISLTCARKLHFFFHLENYWMKKIKGEKLWFLCCNFWALWCVNFATAIDLIHYKILLQFWYGITDLLLQLCCYTHWFYDFLLKKCIGYFWFSNSFLNFVFILCLTLFVKTNRGRIVWFSVLCWCCYYWFIILVSCCC